MIVLFYSRPKAIQILLHIEALYLKVIHDIIIYLLDIGHTHAMTFGSEQSLCGCKRIQL